MNELPHSDFLLTQFYYIYFFSTEAKKREISLAMLCSSAEVLLCDNATTRNSVFDQVMHKDEEAVEGELQQDVLFSLYK